MTIQLKNQPSTQNDFHQRASAHITKRSPWLWLGYLQTRGIEQYRDGEQYAAWLHTHEALKKSDEVYAEEYRRFHREIAWAGVLGITCYAITSSQLTAFWAFACSFAIGSVLIAASFRREQLRRNDAIGRRFSGLR